MQLEIHYGAEPLNKASFCKDGGIWFNNQNKDIIPHAEVLDFVTMDFSHWLKYFSQTKL